MQTLKRYSTSSKTSYLSYPSSCLNNFNITTTTVQKSKLQHVFHQIFKFQFDTRILFVLLCEKSWVDEHTPKKLRRDHFSCVAPVFQNSSLTTSMLPCCYNKQQKGAGEFSLNGFLPPSNPTIFRLEIYQRARRNVESHFQSISLYRASSTSRTNHSQNNLSREST